jgi:glucose-6-phosphate 1-dehydrogenase
MQGQRTELIAVHGERADEMDAYERLLGDAIEGELGLFAREDAVEAAWRIVDPVLHERTPPHEYEPGSFGPDKANGLTGTHGRWHDPRP